MGRKVFISILGSSNYTPCRYFKPEQNFISEEVRFVQEATLSYHNAKNWSSDSVAYICLTSGINGSKEKNWCDNGHLDKKTNKPIVCAGLQTRLKKLKLPFSIKTVSIKDGNNEKEIWSVFDSIFKKLELGDEVYFDITHGFRYLPMLVLVLSNFSKFNKNIQIQSIIYGNFEGRDFNKNEAPLIELKLFSELQDWSSATQAFLETGNPIRIKNLLKASDIETMSDEDLNCLEDFYYEIFEVRGLKIIEGKSVMNAIQILKKVNTKITPFKLLRESLLLNFENFKPNNIENLYEAVMYCQKFNMIQQGVTLFIEYLICKVLFDINENFIDLNNRNIVSAALSINKIECFDYSKFKEEPENNEENELGNCNVKKIVSKIFNLNYKKNLSDKVYKGLSQSTRHDVNHGGFREKPLEIKTLKSNLEKYIKRFNELKIK